MGLQNLLLGLGTALIAVAVIVFTAVNWSQLDAGVQGLILVALTVVAGIGAAVAAKRAMPSTAEAVGLVALLLAVADVHAFRVGFAPAADPMAYWAGGLALVAVLGWTLGRAGGIRSPQVAASVLGQAPLLLVLASLDTVLVVRQLAVVGQALVVLFVADRITGPRWARIAGSAWALAAAAGLTVAVVLDTAFIVGFGELGADPRFGGTAVCLGAAAVLALAVAWLRAGSDLVRVPALLATTVLALAGIWFAGLEVASGDVAIAMVALAAAAVLLLGRVLPRPWGEVPSLTAGATVTLTALPLLAAVSSMLIAASTVSDLAWERSGSVPAASLQLPAASVPSTLALLLTLGALVLVTVAVARAASKAVAGLVGGLVLLLALTVAPLLVPLSVTGTVLLALAAVAGGTVLAVVLGGRSDGFFVAIGFAALAYAWVTPWSLATPTLTFATLGTGILAAVVIGAMARRDDSPAVGWPAAVWVCAAGPLLAGLVTWHRGDVLAAGWAAAAVAAAAISVLGVLLLGSGRTRRSASSAMEAAVEATSLVAYLGALLVTACTGDPQATSVALAAGVLGFAVHGARPHRRLAGLVAAGEALVFTWLQLGQADVVAVEAYTLPLALLLLLVGVAAERLDVGAGGDADAGALERPSWVTYGPALVVAFAPTVWLSFTQPGPGRPLAGLVAGAIVLVAGAVWGKRALVDVGTATVVVLGLRQIAPVVGSMPNWATIGATGVLLLAVGATFEQRRRDLKAAVRRYSALT